MSNPVVLSYGGGLDSWVALLEGVRRGERIDVVAMVDVGFESEHDSGGDGDPGEWPSTYRHVREVVRPFCEQRGIRFVMIDTASGYPVRDARSLFAWLHARKQIPIAGPARICTTVAKVERFERWLDDNFAGQSVDVWIGFEAGEEARAAKDPNVGKKRKPSAARAVRVNRFPLIEWGLCRCRAEQIARASGYAVPRKSACTFCPYASRGDWQRYAVQLPASYGKVVRLEVDKPLTSKGKKLSIMAYNSRKQQPTMLPDFVARPYTRKITPCKVCGAADRATKATSCDYLADAA